MPSDTSPAGLNYQAGLTSRRLNGDVKVLVSPDGVTLTSLFETVFVAFADVVTIERQGWALVITTADDTFTLARVGEFLDALWLDLDGAFNAKVRRALFVSGTPVFSGTGDFRVIEDGRAFDTHGLIEVYDDAICLLPPDDRARRVPFAFATGLQSAPFGLSLTLEGGDSYTVSKLGRDADAFVAAVTARLHALRENAVAAAMALDSALDSTAAAGIASLVLNGVAAPIGRLAGIAPSYVAAVEAAIAASRAAETYQVLRQMCGAESIWVGMKSHLAGEDEDDVLWFIAPSPTRPVAAVELATSDDTAAATFIYNLDGDGALHRINVAMEAIDFHREAVSLPDDQLSTADHGRYRMSVRRIPALGWLRGQLAVRVIHSTAESWTSGVRGYLG